MSHVSSMLVKGFFSCSHYHCVLTSTRLTAAHFWVVSMQLFPAWNDQILAIQLRECLTSLLLSIWNPCNVTAWQTSKQSLEIWTVEFPVRPARINNRHHITQHRERKLLLIAVNWVSPWSRKWVSSKWASPQIMWWIWKYLLFWRRQHWVVWSELDNRCSFSSDCLCQDAFALCLCLCLSHYTHWSTNSSHMLEKGK